AVCVVCFVIGLVAVLVCAAVINDFVSKHRPAEAQQAQTGCLVENYFNQPEEVLSALKSDEVSVRREMFRRLFLTPTIKTVYYDYERDLNYPERVDRARLEYVQLDEGSEMEALMTFDRFGHLVCLISI